MKMLAYTSPLDYCIADLRPCCAIPALEESSIITIRTIRCLTCKRSASGRTLVEVSEDWNRQLSRRDELAQERLERQSLEKPRIRLSRGFWYCRTPGFNGVGPSVATAYGNWLNAMFGMGWRRFPVGVR